MCHALTTRNKPCRARGYSNRIKVETCYQENQEVYYTGFCTRHTNALQHGPLMIWRWDEQYNLKPTAVRLSIKPITS